MAEELLVAVLDPVLEGKLDQGDCSAECSVVGGLGTVGHSSAEQSYQEEPEWTVAMVMAAEPADEK